MSSLKEAGRGAGDTIRHPTTPSQKHQHHDLSQTTGNTAAAPLKPKHANVMMPDQTRYFLLTAASNPG